MPDVDLVVLWVDGNDPAWLAEKRKYEKPTLGESAANGRYRDHGLMPYWFRAVERFFPWVRRIHFVTWGHLPPFLDTSNPKLHVVSHRDFMPEGTLPCFNSTALEMNLFRIPDLAEHFIYFNDDIFPLHRLRKTDFFTDRGVPRMQFTEMPLVFKGNGGTWQMHLVNDLNVVNRHFKKKDCLRGRVLRYYSLRYPFRDNVRSLAMGRLFPHFFVGFRTFHIAQPFCRQTFETVWKEEPELLKETSQHKFRHPSDVNQYVAIWWQLAEGNFKPVRVNARSIMIGADSADGVCREIKRQKLDLLCINDNINLTEEAFSRITEKLTAAFETILPDKSGFEK